MTKHYGLFYTEPTQSLIPHLELLNYNDNIETLKQVAEKFGLKHSNEKLFWNNLTYWSEEDFAYMILEVELFEDDNGKTFDGVECFVKINYQGGNRYFNLDIPTYEELQLVEKPKRTIWIALKPCDDPYYPDNIIFIEESKEKIKEVCEKHFNKSSNDWYDRVIYEDEEEKIISHELKGTDVEIEEVEMGVKI